jgi:hypothetical protein
MFLSRVASLPTETNKEASVSSSGPVVVNGTEPVQPTSNSKSPATPKNPHPNFSDEDLDRLARRGNLNGRQIKNAVRSAQALAVNANEALNISHLMQVLDVAESFERDLKGGSGYTDAMRSYM